MGNERKTPGHETLSCYTPEQICRALAVLAERVFNPDFVDQSATVESERLVWTMTDALEMYIDRAVLQAVEDTSGHGQDELSSVQSLMRQRFPRNPLIESSDIADRYYELMHGARSNDRQAPLRVSEKEFKKVEALITDCMDKISQAAQVQVGRAA